MHIATRGRARCFLATTYHRIGGFPPARIDPRDALPKANLFMAEKAKEKEKDPEPVIAKTAEKSRKQ